MRGLVRRKGFVFRGHDRYIYRCALAIPYLYRPLFVLRPFSLRVLVTGRRVAYRHIVNLNLGVKCRLVSVIPGIAITR